MVAVQYEVSICFSWLALTTKDVCFIIWWAHFLFVFKPPAAISILSVAFFVIYSERNLAKSPLSSGIARKFFQFSGRGTSPHSMFFPIGLNVFVCRFLVSYWVSLALYLSKNTQICRWAERACSRTYLFSLFCYILPLHTSDKNVGALLMMMVMWKSSLTYFCPLLIYKFLVTSLHILGHLEENSEFLLYEKGA